MKSSSDGKKTDRKKLEELFRKHGYEDFKWMDPRGIVVAQWARMKCMFGLVAFASSSSLS